MGSKDVWAVGTEGTILRYDGTSWTVASDGESYSLNDVWGSSPSDVYAVGTSGTIIHYDGKRFHELESGTVSTLNGVWGAPANDVWVVGENGTILRRQRRGHRGFRVCPGSDVGHSSCRQPPRFAGQDLDDHDWLVLERIRRRVGSADLAPAHPSRRAGAIIISLVFRDQVHRDRAQLPCAG